MLFDEIENKNPVDVLENTHLHWAAKMGHLKICEYIVSKAVDKNLAITHSTAMGPKLCICSVELRYSGTELHFKI